MNLNVRVETLGGVGPTMAAKLERLGIKAVGDLLNHFPRRYEDFSQIIPIRSMKPGPVTFRGQVAQIASRRGRNRRLSITEAIISDATGTAKAVWFNQPFLVRQFPPGTPVMVSGKLEFRNSDLALQTPAIEKDEGGESKHTGRIVAVYPETEGLTSKQLRNLIMPLLNLTDDLPEVLPEQVVKKAKLMSRAEAVKEVHAPSSEDSMRKARYRLGFEELFFIIAASLAIKHEIKTEPAPKVKLDVAEARRFTGALDFELTNGQRQAAWQILNDMAGEQPMNRLLEGDVGSGKTMVAILAAAMAIASGYQAALMVPTDILARQHFQKLAPLLKKLGIKSELLLGRLPAAAKQQALDAAANGSAQLMIGTHALVSEQVKFKNLGLVVIDEQHRFGVEQRQALKQKAGHLPHLLSMTATPIPRSLTLTVYGDLDLSVIDELPPGRQPIGTKVIQPKDRELMYDFINKQISSGRQVFVVCPLIEDSDLTGAKSVTAEAERLKAGPFARRSIAVMHGRMKAPERDEIMQKFAAGEINILVATSVIEVGIDVPNATIMLIEGAERFGLAALHQLRGRVGRGEHRSYCMVASDSTAPGVVERLQALERTHDGFRLAQIDLELRGPGQIYGRRQHGMLELDMADLGDSRLVAAVRAAAEDFVTSKSDMLQYPQVVERINRLKSVTSLD
ncbi:MAG TPA: ATP-dependent DNA helicase RecG [Candidatus Saccharimonadales bacterium]|nr:ATP-dependent DNA helicase RecG [Candidatus Saccharimonadales bacterium]